MSIFLNFKHKFPPIICVDFIILNRHKWRITVQIYFTQKLVHTAGYHYDIITIKIKIFNKNHKSDVRVYY